MIEIMTIKLMKYEFMATRFFLSLFAALLVTAGVSSLLTVLGLDAPRVISYVVVVMLMVGVFVVAIVRTIQRFWENLLSSEGHLMMTLPVKVDSLILSKLFMSSIWIVAGILVVVLAIAIMGAAQIVYLPDMMFWRAFDFEISATLVLELFEVLVLAALGLFSGILMLYACMSLSMLANKHRGIWAFAAYMAISTILQIVGGIVATVVGMLELNFGVFDRMFENMSMFARGQVVIVGSIALAFLVCAVFYGITRYMLKNRLNLQ